jgi:ribosomal-protein-alanine N-acetyltransferase
MRIIRSARLELDPLRAIHAAEMFPVLAYPELYLYDSAQHPASVDALAERYGYLEARRSPDGLERWLNWIVRLGETRAPLGFVQATLYEDATASIAYVLTPAAQGQGYAREATRAMMAELETAYGIREMRASVDPRNERSIRLLLDLGFVIDAAKEGTGDTAGDIFFSRRRS